jgi:hypothetical protein
MCKVEMPLGFLRTAFNFAWLLESCEEPSPMDKYSKQGVARLM